jgi:hypothetical protein
MSFEPRCDELSDLIASERLNVGVGFASSILGSPGSSRSGNCLGFPPVCEHRSNARFRIIALNAADRQESPEAEEKVFAKMRPRYRLTNPLY